MIEVGILQYPGAQLAAVYGLNDLFMVANRHAFQRGAPERSLIRTTEWSGDKHTDVNCINSASSGGSSLQFVIVPPSLSGPSQRDAAQPYTNWLLHMHRRGATLCSVCSGVFLLAETGLLAGRPATTHWSYVKLLKERYPDIEVSETVSRRLVVDDGDVITAAGVMAWTDLGIWLVDRMLGSTIADETAKFLMLDDPSWLHTNIFKPKLHHGDEAILRVQHFLQSRGAMDTTIAGMAAIANLEPRTFLRRFVRATGVKPSEYAQQIRVKRALDMLETTKKSIDQIAWLVGYKDTRAFCKIFVKHLGFTPANYRSNLNSRHRQIEDRLSSSLCSD